MRFILNNITTKQQIELLNVTGLASASPSPPFLLQSNEVSDVSKEPLRNCCKIMKWHQTVDLIKIRQVSSAFEAFISGVVPTQSVVVDDKTVASAIELE